MPKLLLPNKKLDGSRRVTMTLRPRRVAFLVDPFDSAIALAAIEAACLEWGGRYHFLIPCEPNGEPHPVWARILEKHDPDVIVDLIGASEGFLTFQDDQRDRLVRRWDRPTSTMQLVGPVVYGALRRWKRLRHQGTANVALNLHPLTGHPLALPLAFRFGHLDLRPMDRNMVIHESYDSARLRNFVDLREVDPHTLPEAELVRLVTEIPLSLTSLLFPSSEMTDYWTLPNLTTISLSPAEPSYHFGNTAKPDPEREQHDEAYLRRIVVVGATTSVQNLCLAWNLRAQRGSRWLFPIWVDPEWLRDEAVTHRIDLALGQGSGGMSEEHGPPIVHLVSATLARSDLELAAKDALPTFVTHGPSELDLFFTDEFKVGWEQPFIIDFHDGTADVPIPDDEQLGEFDIHERLGWTLSINGYVLPRLPRRAFKFSASQPRLATDGLAGFVNVPWNSAGKFISVRTHDGWEVVTAAAFEAGYKPRLSDKGRLALAIMGLLGDEIGYSALASSRVYALLRNMAEIVQRQAVQQAVRRRLEHALSSEQIDAVTDSVRHDVLQESQFDRQHYTWEKLKQELGSNVSQGVLELLVSWLVTRRILLQGYESTCPSCGLRRWYPINRLADTRLCDGCQSNTTSPVSVTRLEWSYRLNELVARGIDQGVLPHIMAVRKINAWGAGRAAALLGVLPGVELSPADADGRSKIEVDLFAINRGRVIIGECKAGGDRLTEEIANRFADLGQRFNASRIVYATPADFDMDRGVLARAETISEPARVEIWEADGMLDCWPSGVSQGVTGKGRPYEYLEWLASRLTELSPY